MGGVWVWAAYLRVRINAFLQPTLNGRLLHDSVLYQTKYVQRAPVALAGTLALAVVFSFGA